MAIKLPIVVNPELSTPIDGGRALCVTLENSIDRLIWDLKLEQHTSTSIARVDEKIVYTIKVSNNGPNIAKNLVVIDIIQNGAYIYLAQGTIGFVEQIENKLLWTIPMIDVGENAIASIVVIPTSILANNFLTNTTILTCDNILLNPSQVTDTTSIYIEKFSNIILKKHIQECIVYQNENQKHMSYMIKVKNKGPNIANDIAIIEYMQQGLKVIYIDSPKGNITYSHGKIIWEIKSLIVEEVAVAYIEVAMLAECKSVEMKTKAISNVSFINPQNSEITTHINFTNDKYSRRNMY